jgi:hypothetical protein
MNPTSTLRKQSATKGYVRDKDDFYPTPLECTVALYDAEAKFMPKELWEPACGDGAISRYLESKGHTVYSTDLIDRGYGQGGVDFLAQAKPLANAIVTNPPWKKGLVDDFVRHALFDLRVDYMALLLPALWFHGSKRIALYDAEPPARIRILGWRPDLFGIGSPDQRCCVTWFVWDKNTKIKTQTTILRRP